MFNIHAINIKVRTYCNLSPRLNKIKIYVFYWWFCLLVTFLTVYYRYQSSSTWKRNTVRLKQYSAVWTHILEPLASTSYQWKVLHGIPLNILDLEFKYGGYHAVFDASDLIFQCMAPSCLDTIIHYSNGLHSERTIAQEIVPPPLTPRCYPIHSNCIPHQICTTFGCALCLVYLCNLFVDVVEMCVRCRVLSFLTLIPLAQGQS